MWKIFYGPITHVYIMYILVYTPNDWASDTKVKVDIFDWSPWPI